MNEKDKGRLIDIINFAQEAIGYLGSCSEVEFADNRLLQRACERCVGVVGEAAGHVSKELTDSTPQFPWKEATGMRFVLAHNVGGVDVGILYVTVKDKLPLLIKEAKRIIEDQNP